MNSSHVSKNVIKMNSMDYASHKRTRSSNWTIKASQEMCFGNIQVGCEEIGGKSSENLKIVEGFYENFNILKL